MRTLSVLAGMVLGAICVWGLRIDILNNYQYGLNVSNELASVLVAAALGVAVLPAVAGLKGWNWLYGVGTVGCIVLTVIAAFLSYTGRQGDVAVARQTLADAYESSRRDEAEARAVVAAISETASVDELKLIVDEAKAKSDREAGRGGCLGKCEAAKENYTKLVYRLGQAKAKEAALGRVANAQEKAKEQPSRVPMSAKWIEAQTGWEAATVSQSIDIGFAVLSILVTQLFALLGHPAVALIAWGLVYDDNYDERLTTTMMTGWEGR